MSKVSSVFGAETALIEQGEGRFSGTVSAHYNIGDNPNGGYLVAIVLGAVARVNPDHPDPLTVTTHYLRPGLADAPCDVQVELIRKGRSMTTCRARLSQGGKARLEVLTAFGDLADNSAAVVGETPVTLAMPSIPSPIDCPERSGVAQGVDLPILDRVEIRVNPEDAPLTTPEEAQCANAGGRSAAVQNKKARVSGWIRLRDQSPTDTRSAVMFTDAFPPALFGLLGVIGWVPTIELTVHMRRRPATPWLLGSFATDDLHGGRMIESGALWDEEGVLVAQSRQLGLLLGR